jgi:hypothetical protein
LLLGPAQFGALLATSSSVQSLKRYMTVLTRALHVTETGRALRSPCASGVIVNAAEHRRHRCRGSPRTQRLRVVVRQHLGVGEEGRPARWRFLEALRPASGGGSSSQ